MRVQGFISMAWKIHVSGIWCSTRIQARLLSIELNPSQVEGGPDDVEEGEEDEAEVLQKLGAAAQEELKERQRGFQIYIPLWFDDAGSEMWLDFQHLAYPDEEPDEGGDAEGRGVVAEPSEVKGNLDAEVLRNVPWRKEIVQFIWVAERAFRDWPHQSHKKSLAVEMLTKQQIRRFL